MAQSIQQLSQLSHIQNANNLINRDAALRNLAVPVENALDKAVKKVLVSALSAAGGAGAGLLSTPLLGPFAPIAGFITEQLLESLGNRVVNSISQESSVQGGASHNTVVANSRNAASVFQPFYSLKNFFSNLFRMNPQKTAAITSQNLVPNSPQYNPLKSPQIMTQDSSAYGGATAAIGPKIIPQLVTKKENQIRDVLASTRNENPNAAFAQSGFTDLYDLPHKKKKKMIYKSPL